MQVIKIAVIFLFNISFIFAQNIKDTTFVVYGENQLFNDQKNLLYDKNYNFEFGVKDWVILNCKNFSIIKRHADNYIKIGSDSTPNPTLISSKLAIPVSLNGKSLEFMANISGYINAITINNGNGKKIFWYDIQAKIPEDQPLKIRFIVPGEKLANVDSIYIRIFGFNSNFHSPTEYFTVGNVQISEAIKTVISVPDIFIGHQGINYTSYDTGIKYHWLTDKFNMDNVKNDVKIIEQMGDVVRIWCSADNLSDFDNNGIWNGFNHYIVNLDSIFNTFQSHGLKIIPTIFSQSYWSDIKFSSQIVSNNAIANGYLELCKNFVKRFKKYNCIIGWDICNESFNTTLTGNLDSQNRFLSYSDAYNFMTSTYTSIKTIDRARSVIATFWFPFEAWSLITPEKFCDIVGYSAYLGNGIDTVSILNAKESTNSENFLSYKTCLSIPYFISETGAPSVPQEINGEKKILSLYRDTEINSKYLSYMFSHRNIFRDVTMLAWRDIDVLWSRGSKQIELDGAVLQKTKK